MNEHELLDWRLGLKFEEKPVIRNNDTDHSSLWAKRIYVQTKDEWQGQDISFFFSRISNHVRLLDDIKKKVD